MPGRFPKPFRHHDHPREVVRQFTPNWFTVTMGTGVVALALNQCPGAGSAAHGVAFGLWIINIVLYAICTSLYARTLAGGYRGHLFVAPCLVTGQLLPKETSLSTWPG